MNPLRPTMLFAVLASAIASADETQWVNAYVQKVISQKTPAVLASCSMGERRTNEKAMVIVPMNGEAGLFVLFDGARVANSGDIRWGNGAWKLDELSGGVATIQFLNNVVDQLLKGQMKLVSPDKLRASIDARAIAKCKVTVE